MTSPDPTPIRSTRDAGGAQVTLSRAVRVYLDDVAVRTGKKHWKREQCCLDAVLGKVGDRPLADIQRQVILDYRTQRLTKDGVGKTTVNHEVDALRRCLGFAVDNGEIPFNPARDIKKLQVRTRDRRKLRRSMTDDEYDRFVDAAQMEDAAREKRGGGAIPQAPLYLTLLNTGGRLGATLKLRWRHLEFEVDLIGDGSELGAYVTFPDALVKTGKGRVLPVPPEGANALQALLEAHRRHFGDAPSMNDLVFLTPRGMPWTDTNKRNALRTFYRILKRASIQREIDGRQLDLHACRTTYNTRLHRAGVDVGDRQDLMGHSDPRLTEVAYTDRDVAGRARAIQKLIQYEAKRRGISEEEALGELLAALAGDRSNPSAVNDQTADAAYSGNSVNTSCLRAEEHQGQTEEAMTTNPVRVPEGWRRHPDSNRGITDLQSAARSTEPESREKSGEDVLSSADAQGPAIVECESLGGAAVWLQPGDLSVLTDALAQLARGRVVLLTGKRPGGAL